jgi:hypothetical protein
MIDSRGRASARYSRITPAPRWLVALLFLSAPFSHVSSQTLAQQTRQVAATEGGPTRIISANPFLPLLGYFAAELEQRVSNAASVALSGSHIEPDNARYTNVDVKGRLYPTERGLHGFNMAASLGFARIRQTEGFECAAEPCPAPKAFSTGSFAVELGYQWMLGPSKVTVVSVGGGAKRYLGSDDKFTSINRVMPTLRLNVGYAF